MLGEIGSQHGDGAAGEVRRGRLSVPGTGSDAGGDAADPSPSEQQRGGRRRGTPAGRHQRARGRRPAGGRSRSGGALMGPAFQVADAARAQSRALGQRFLGQRRGAAQSAQERAERHPVSGHRCPPRGETAADQNCVLLCRRKRQQTAFGMVRLVCIQDARMRLAARAAPSGSLFVVQECPRSLHLAS